MARESSKSTKKVTGRQSKKKAARKAVTSSPSKRKAYKISKKASKKTRASSEEKRKTVSTKRPKAKTQGNKKNDRTSSGRLSKTDSPNRGSKLSAAHKIAIRRKAAGIRTHASAIQKSAKKTLAAQKASERVALEKQGQHYEKAVGYFNNRKFSRALLWFEKATGGPDPTIRHRAQVHVHICTKQASSATLKLRTADEYYDYGIKLINDRELEEAERCLQKALRMSSNADYVYYATAVVKALKGAEEAAALENLRQAIELDPRNRLLARSDADLLSLRDYPGWDELMSSDTPDQQDSEEPAVS